MSDITNYIDYEQLKNMETNLEQHYYIYDEIIIPYRRKKDYFVIVDYIDKQICLLRHVPIKQVLECSICSKLIECSVCIPHTWEILYFEDNIQKNITIH